MRPTGYVSGDWLATCHKCGFTRLASQMVRHWEGYYVCPQHNEERHPQDFVKPVHDDQTVPWAQPEPEDIFIQICTVNSRSAMPGRSLPGCMMPGNAFVDATQDAPEPLLCDIYEVQGVPGWAGPGCAIPNFDPFAA